VTVVPGLVSTIIPVFNRPELLREAVASVLAQTYRPIEVIIVDDGSTDSTPAVCVELTVAHPEVSFARVPNGGPGQAREVGRLRARGEFLQYLDSDDLLDPRKFAAQVEALRRVPEAGVAYCRTREYRIGSAVEDVASARTGTVFHTLFPDLLDGRVWQTVSPLFRRGVTEEAGPWTNLRQEEDWEYDAKIAATGARLVWNDDFLADFRHHTASRAGGHSLGSPEKMRWRYEAHRLILGHARRHGVTTQDPHMARFARELFLLARQCGAVGLGDESRHLFELARQASAPPLARAWDFSLYKALTRVIGWCMAGRLACWSDRFRAAS
jgi:glycosyltransferase involved in cell wall biosynthesis